MSSRQQSEVLMDEKTAMPKSTTDDITRLLRLLIRVKFPEKFDEIAEIGEITQESVVAKKEEVISVTEEKENLEHAENFAVPLEVLKSPTPTQNLSRHVKEHPSYKTLSKHPFTIHTKTPKQRARGSMQKSVSNENDIIKMNRVKLKKKIRVHKMHDGFQARRKGVWVCVLDDRELMKFKSD
jgi:hypothetical protein